MESFDITLKDDELIEFVFDDDTIWLANPETLDQIFPEEALKEDKRGISQFQIPTEITMPADERGIVKKALVRLVNILAKKAIQKSVNKLASELEDKQLENKTGLFRLTPDFQLLEFNPAVESKRTFCLFIHGTASSIQGSFGDVEGTDLMQYLQSQYEDRILGFQHRTLTENPVQNVRILVEQLPEECTLHLITTSRGGLVGEVLSRFCNNVGNVKGFSTEEMEYFKEKYPQKYSQSLSKTISEIDQIVRTKLIKIEKFVRIACPAGGTTLASSRLDHYLNIGLNLIGLGTGAATNPVFIAFKNLISAVIDSKDDANTLPGLEVQRPESPFIEVLNGINHVQTVQIDNSLAVIAGNSKVSFKLKALLIIASKLFYGRDNDLVVDTVSMLMGTPRTGSKLEYFYEGKDINHFKYFENPKTNKAILWALKIKWGDPVPGFEPISIIKLEKRDVDLSGVKLANPLLELTHKHIKTRKKETPIKVSVCSGDLSFAPYPVLAGHFENDSILYAEKVIDKNMNYLLSQFKQVGNYPGKIKDSRVFLTHKKGFRGTIIIGLGRPEKLTPSELSQTVEAGVIDYLFNLQKNQNISVDDYEGTQIGLSSLIIGCGYGGLAIEKSIQAILQGVRNANSAMLDLDPETKFTVKHIEFIEVFEDKAVNSLFTINRIASEEPDFFCVEKENHGFTKGLGTRKRIPQDAAQDWWNRLTVIKDEDENKTIRKLEFSASTQSARVEQQPLLTTPALMDAMIEEMSTQNDWNPVRAKTVFEMLIPNDFKDELKRHGNIVWVLDDYTASYPWELLQDENLNETDPICVSSGMIRQLKTTNYRRTIKNVSRNNALVLADPDLDGFAGQLSGALKEGKQVAQMLLESGMEVTESYNEQHLQILEKVFGDEYKIIHLSGHGVFNEDPDKGSGMVIGRNKFLSTREIKQMSTVPEFVFVNCCHLGKSNGVSEELYQQRFKLAANIGTQLINNGVRCVIAAGWAVNDSAALDFAEEFYHRMNSGATFGKAVKEARKVIFEKYPETNTWGAYQAYGDPFYRFKKREDEKITFSYFISNEAEIDLKNLLSEIEIGKVSVEEYLHQLDAISIAVDKCGVRNKKITELEAMVSMELREFTKACNKFKEVLDTNNDSVSFTSFEKYQNVRAKKAIEDYNDKKDSADNLINELEDVISKLTLLIQIGQTAERINILGSTFKRKAFLITDQDSKLKAYENAAYYYQDAYTKFGTWYSLTNWLIIEAIFTLSGKRKWNTQVGTEPKQYKLLSLDEANQKLDDLEKSVSSKAEGMNYWEMIKDINIKLCKYILNFSKNKAQSDLTGIQDGISELWEKAGSKGKHFAEIEHLEFIIDALSMEQNKLTELLQNNVINMKTELEKLITKR